MIVTTEVKRGVRSIDFKKREIFDIKCLLSER